MKAQGNGRPETCAFNLLRIVRGEIPFDRVRGRDGALIDQPSVADEAQADAKWVLSTYEPRVEIESVEMNPEAASAGDFSELVKIKRKEDDEEWLS